MHKASFPVTDKKIQELVRAMADLNIREEEIVERFVRAQGKGGQHVNKVATCVYLKHLPTGLEVKCQKERSQALNRFFARRLLVKKIEERQRGRKSAEKQRIAKIRRQKRKRSKRAKEKMLAAKKKRAAVKKLRGKIEAEE